MAPEEAVARLAEIIAGRGEFTEDDLYAAMAEAGLPDPVADRAFKFTQTAWGRVFLGGLGVQFSPNYLCFNGAGDVIESGRLSEQPYFVAAMDLVPRYARSPGFQRLALMSADVNAVNDLLHAGSKPENLVMSPAAFFLEAATPAGLAKAQQLLADRARSSGKASSRASPKAEAPAAKPWWRFW
jgi:hypothetical protein